MLAQATFTTELTGIFHTGSNKGMAVGDYNNDGLEDIYVSRQTDENLLYENTGLGVYFEVADDAGIDFSGKTYTSAFGDFDNDGDLDLYLGNINQSNRMYRNNGDGTFSNITPTANVGNIGPARGIHLADVDADGYLDIYLTNLAMDNVFYHNNGDFTFTEQTEEVGLSNTLLSMGGVFFDYDNDGDQDLYLVHDNYQPNALMQNDGSGHFTDVAEQAGVAYEAFGMGVDVADVNRDGHLDLYITNLYENVLFLNNGDGTFRDISAAAGVDDYGMGWGTAFLDYDNDGWVDIYVANDSYFSDYPNVLYHNNRDSTFSIVSADSPLASMYGSYGCVTPDLNNDGLLDIVITNWGNNGGNELFTNATPEPGNWLKVQLAGEESNRSAIGSRITMRAGGQVWVDEVNAGSGYASQNSPILHFGLGPVDTIEELTIRWPTGEEEVYEGIAANQLLHYTETVEVVTGIEQPGKASLQLSISPNPVREQLQVSMKTAVAGQSKLRLLNLQGQVVVELMEGELQAGSTSRTWAMEPWQLPGGVYLLEWRVAGEVLVEKMILH